MAAYYNEIEPFAAQWIRNLITAGHIAPGEVDERSIEDVTPADLKGFAQCHFFAGVAVWSYALRRAGVSDDEPVWTGSCPCQPFSAAGKGNGFADERHLWPAFHYLIEQCRPPIVFGEQVASRDAEPWIDLVQTDLEALGYTFGAVPFASASVGAPHIRDRLYWVADSTTQRRQHEPTLAGSDGTVAGAARPRLGISGDSDACGLADAAQRGIRALDRESGQGIRREEPFRGYSVSRGMDHTHDARLEGLGRGYQAEGGRIVTAGSVTEAGESGGMADADQQQRNGGGNVGAGGRAESSECGAVDRPGPTNGYWRDADWLFCRDGRWRPVRPGTFPLVASVAGSLGRVRADWHAPAGPQGFGHRAGRLKGYGNAINAAQAEIFIRCVMECRP